MTPMEHLESISVRMEAAPYIMKEGIISRSLALQMLRSLHEEYGRVIERLEGDNVVTLPQRRPSSLGLRDQGR